MLLSCDLRWPVQQELRRSGFAVVQSLNDAPLVVVSDDAMPEADAPGSDGQQLAHAGASELAANTMAMSELVKRVAARIACIDLRTNE